MSHLKEYLEQLDEKLPGDIEPEHDESDTIAQIAENDKSHYLAVPESKLKPVQILNDKKYTGVKVTREQLEQSSESEDDDRDEEMTLLSGMNESGRKENITVEDDEEDYTKLYAPEAGSDESEEEGIYQIIPFLHQFFLYQFFYTNFFTPKNLFLNFKIWCKKKAKFLV